MKISGFTFVRNATRLYIPIAPSIASLLPLVDEYVVALGRGDADDRTEAEIAALNSPKIRLVRTEWNTEDYRKNTVFARQTDLAKEACTGDWLFYLQGDEAVHEKYLPVVRQALEHYYQDEAVEGLLFHYRHFWGDFAHYNPSHVFYRREVRVIRNRPEIHSYRDAQGFRWHLRDFGYREEDYLRSSGTRKLRVAEIPAEIYHYGWVRPPRLMSAKRKVSSTTYRGAVATEKQFARAEEHFDYGPLQKLPLFRGTHPRSMQEWTRHLPWRDELQYHGGLRPKAYRPKHERRKYRFLTWLEQRLLGGRRIGEYKNFEVVRKFRF